MACCVTSADVGVSGVWCLVSGVWCLVSGVWCGRSSSSWSVCRAAGLPPAPPAAQPQPPEPEPEARARAMARARARARPAVTGGASAGPPSHRSASVGPSRSGHVGDESLTRPRPPCINRSPGAPLSAVCARHLLHDSSCSRGACSCASATLALSLTLALALTLALTLALALTLTLTLTLALILASALPSAFAHAARCTFTTRGGRRTRCCMASASR
jgi:hypothetical protein